MGSGHLEDLIRQSAASLRKLLGNGRTIYHVAETQFAFFALPGMDLQSYSKDVAQILREHCNRTTTSFLTTISIGIAPFVLRHVDYGDVLRMAHNASQDAFESDEHVCVYSLEQDAAHLRRFTLLNKFSQALENPGRLRLVYQPRIDIASGACIGAEALLRWTDPDLGAVSPGEFMPLVELSSMARPITSWVLDTAICQLRQWQQEGTSLQVSVNISASNLLEPDFCERLIAMLQKYGVEPSRLELELTESAFMSHPGKAQAMLESIAKTGVRLAIDDFGTGYSSLSYLQSLPAHVVKIDQSFIRELVDDERRKMLVGAMVALSHDLGYRVVAEGVETEQAFAFLGSIGCNEAQGYFFAKPMSSKELADWLGKHHALLA
jgi:EAL domain-containing protein (putative c-di-GMP-specific phosphodiesterase class I)